MAFNIIIKPLVLFDLEDKIKLLEYEASGGGKRLYQTFLSGLAELQNLVYDEAIPIFETVKKYVSKDASYSLFYTTKKNTILIIGMM